MPYPRKFKKLLEMELKDVKVPDYVWLTYAVCATERESCGWGGWIIEAAFERSRDVGANLLPAVDEHLCPRCGKKLFRT